MRLIEPLTDKLIKDEVILSDEVEIVKYGLENIGFNILGLAVTLFIGIYFGFFVESFILWLLIFPLRKNSGGYHANTKIGCLLVSSGMLFLFFVLFVRIDWKISTYFLISLITFGIIFWLAPVGNQNKVLDTKEEQVYKKRTRKILILEETIGFLACLNNWETLVALISINFTIVAISLVAGRLKLLQKGKTKTFIFQNKLDL